MSTSLRLGAIALAIGFSGLANAGTTLTVASFPNFDAAVKAAIPLYKKSHPDVEIKLVSLAIGDHHNAMTTALATGVSTGLPVLAATAAAERIMLNCAKAMMEQS